MAYTQFRKRLAPKKTEGYYFDKEAHVHYLDGKPLYGCSSIVGVLDKPLTWWAAEHAAVTCLEKGEHIPTIREEYEAAAVAKNKKELIDELQKKYPIFKEARFAHFKVKDKKADQGTDMHARLEEYVKFCIDYCSGEPVKNSEMFKDKQVQEFADWAVENVATFLWSEAHCYNRELWIGGITDAGATLLTGKRAIIDFKSSPSAWDSHFFQAGGYAEAIEHSGGLTSEGEKIFDPIQIDEHIIVAFGGGGASIHYSPNPQDDREAFKNAKALHHILNMRKK